MMNFLNYRLGTLYKFNVLLLSGIFISIVGCHTNPEKSNTIASSIESPMKTYTSSMRSVSLPFIDTCYDTVATQAVSIPDTLSKFKKYGRVIGKVNETDKYIAILYSLTGDVQLPVLRTFNKNGEPISTQKLLIGNCCGENEACTGLSIAKITKDLHIILIDSNQTFERDKKKSDIKKNIQLHYKLLEFTIDSTGMIKFFRKLPKDNPSA